jgi:hypothetical protein
VSRVRETIGAVVSLREVDVVPALPKTRSGKILRATMRAIADGEEVVVPSTIDDAGVLDALRPMLRHDGPKGDRLQARRSDQTSSDARSTAASLELAPSLSSRLLTWPVTVTWPGGAGSRSRGLAA